MVEKVKKRITTFDHTSKEIEAQSEEQKEVARKSTL
jgi:hypothetical protein